MRVTTLILSATLTLSLAGSAFAQAGRDQSTQPGSSDTQFAQKAAAGGMMEVEMGKTAADKAANADVKAFANRLVKDHTAANQELMGIMKNKGITPTASAEKPEPWQSQSGAAFDRGFIDHAVDHHQKDVALFEMEAKSGKDAELKAFAAKTLPTLREHLKMAQDLKSKMKTTTSQ